MFSEKAKSSISSILNPSRYSDSTRREGCQSALQCSSRYCSHELSSAISSNENISLSLEFRRITGGDMKLSGLLTLSVLNCGLKIRVAVSAADRIGLSAGIKPNKSTTLIRQFLGFTIVWVFCRGR